MKMNIRNLGYIIVAICIFFVSMLAKAENNYYVIWISIIALFAEEAIYVASSRHANILFGVFLISFFTFMLGKYASQLFQGEIEPFINIDIFCQESMYISASLLVLFISFVFFDREPRTNRPVYDVSWQENYSFHTGNVLRLSEVLFYISIACSIAVNLEIALRAFEHVYGSVSLNSNLPFAVQKIAQTHRAFFWIFAACLPSKEQMKMPSILFTINACLILFTGVRGTTVTEVMSLLMYFYFRNTLFIKSGHGERWISRINMLAMMLLLPVCIVFLGLFANLRLGNSLGYDGLWNGIVSFFEQQGGSADVIGRAIYCKQNGLLPKTNYSYTFGPVINAFRNGPIGSLLGISVPLGSHTVELAEYGNNLGATVTYLMSPGYYSIGGGYGTAYIAELSVDFGYIGVIVFHVLLGWLLNKIDYFNGNYWFGNAVGLLIIRCIIYMPRDFALNVVGSIVSWTYIIPFVALLLIDNQLTIRRVDKCNI